MAIYSNDQYYEGKLQLRPDDAEVLDFVYSLIDKRYDVLISKEVKLKTGIDLYVNNKKWMLMMLRRQLKKKFEGEFKVSRTLYGRRRGSTKLVYRSTLLFRLKKE